MQTFKSTLKALFLAMDATLCDTTKANDLAITEMATRAHLLISNSFNGAAFAQTYVRGIYRELDSQYTLNLPSTANEEEFRHQLILRILNTMGQTISAEKAIDVAIELQQTFDNARTQYFDFYPGIQDWLKSMRDHYQLVVITNGPEFSQVAKVQRVNLIAHVDHVIIGGQEPAQKPDKSIFEKALGLCHCNADQVIHIGDSLTTDIQGALNAGIASVWVQHGQEPRADIQADWVIGSPLELEGLLNNILQ